MEKCASPIWHEAIYFLDNYSLIEVKARHYLRRYVFIWYRLAFVKLLSKVTIIKITNFNYGYHVGSFHTSQRLIY